MLDAAPDRAARPNEEDLQRMRRLLTSMAVGVFLLCTGAAASGPEDKQDEPAQTGGILPLPDYGGDLWTRTHLLSDLGGARSDLANKGLQLGIEWTQQLRAYTKPVTYTRGPGSWPGRCPAA